MAKGLIVVEGHGEDGAAPNLVTRLWADLGLPHAIWSPRPIRCAKLSSLSTALPGEVYPPTPSPP